MLRLKTRGARGVPHVYCINYNHEARGIFKCQQGEFDIKFVML